MLNGLLITERTVDLPLRLFVILVFQKYVMNAEIR
jgi:hypothetical protein